MTNPNSNWTYHACASNDLALILSRKSHKGFFLSNRENGFGNTRVTIPILQLNQDYQSDINLVKNSMNQNPNAPYAWSLYGDLKYCVDMSKTNNNALIREGNTNNAQAQDSVLWNLEFSNPPTTIPIATSTNTENKAIGKQMLMDVLSSLYNSCRKSMALSIDSIKFVRNPENKAKPLANIERTYKLTMKVLSHEIKELLNSSIDSAFFKGFLAFIDTKKKKKKKKKNDFLKYLEEYIGSIDSRKINIFETKTFKLKPSDLLGNKLIQHRFDIKECFGYFHIAEGSILDPNVVQDGTNVVGFGFTSIPSDINPIFNKNDVQIYPLVQPQVNTYDANNIVNKNNACNDLTWLNGCSLFTRTPIYNCTNEYQNTLLIQSPYSNGLLNVDFDSNTNRWNYNLKGFFPLTSSNEFQNSKINASNIVGQSIPSCYVKASLLFDANELSKEMLGQELNSLVYIPYFKEQKQVKLLNISQKPKYITIELERFFDLLDYKIDLIEKPQSFQPTRQASTIKLQRKIVDTHIEIPNIQMPQREMIPMSNDMEEEYSMYNPPLKKQAMDDSKNLLWLYLLGLGSIMGYSYWRYYKKTKNPNNTK